MNSRTANVMYILCISCLLSVCFAKSLGDSACHHSNVPFSILINGNGKIQLHVYVSLSNLICTAVQEAWIWKEFVTSLQ